MLFGVVDDNLQMLMVKYETVHDGTQDGTPDEVVDKVTTVLSNMHSLAAR